MAKEAEAHAAEDKQRLSEVDARNRLDNLVYQVEKLLKENREKLGDADVKTVEDAIQGAHQALTDGNLDKLSAAIDRLTKASHRIAETLYKAQQSGAASAPGGGAGGGASGGPSSADGATKPGGQGDVVDAEFVDVDESKRPN